MGVNAGGWWSSSSAVNTVGSPSFISDLGAPGGAAAIATMLANIGTNDFSINQDGFIGGGQIGYNFQYNKNLVLGIDADMDGLTQSNIIASTNKTVTTADFADYYASSVIIHKNIHYLGTLRGRLGLLVTPTLLVYGAGGLAYGGVSFNTSFAGNDPVNALSFSTQNNLNKVLAGWTAGAGGEWEFRQNWSAKIEYLYYDLGTMNNNIVLAQLLGTSPFASANVHSSSHFALGAVRVGLNYHFS